MREGVSRSGALLIVLVAFCLPIFIGLGSSDLGNDEAIYSYAAESILTTGDWLSPRSSPNEHIIFLEKPPLKFWIVAAPIRLGLLPLNEFGLRFWDAVFGALAFVYLFLLGSRLGGPLCGAFAVLVLFVHQPLLFEHGLRSNNMEAALLLAYCGGVYHFLRWLQADAGRRGWRHVAAFTGFLFLAFMTKFVAAAFLPLVCGLTALLVRDGRTALRQDWRRWVVAALVFIALAAPWFIYHAVQHFDDLWSTMFRDHVVTRFTAYVDPAHVQPWHYYFSQMIEEFGWSRAVFWAAAGLCLLLVDAVRARRTITLMVLIWAFVPTILISFGSSKVYHYVYPFLPPFALAAGYAAWSLYRWLVHAVGALMSRWRPDPGKPFPPAVRVIGGVIVLLAITVAAVTLVHGPIRFSVAGTFTFSNNGITRALFVAAVGLILAGGGRRWLGAAVALVVIGAWLPSPIQKYTATFEQLRVTKRPIGALADCIRSVHRTKLRHGERVEGVYAPVSHEAFLHPYFYYLRGHGWHREPNDEVLREALFAPDHASAVAIDPSRYRDFLARHPGQPEPVAIALDSIIVALPGPFERCVGTQHRGRP